jgi:hypothetical protein
VIVAVIAVRMMQPPVDQEVDVIAVRDRVVATVLAVVVARIAIDRIGVTVRMLGVDRDRIVDVVLMRVVQMPVVDVIDVIVVTTAVCPQPSPCTWACSPS